MYQFFPSGHSRYWNKIKALFKCFVATGCCIKRWSRKATLDFACFLKRDWLRQCGFTSEGLGRGQRGGAKSALTTFSSLHFSNSLISQEQAEHVFETRRLICGNWTSETVNVDLLLKMRFNKVKNPIIVFTFRTTHTQPLEWQRRTWNMKTYEPALPFHPTCWKPLWCLWQSSSRWCQSACSLGGTRRIWSRWLVTDRMHREAR